MHLFSATCRQFLHYPFDEPIVASVLLVHLVSFYAAGVLLGIIFMEVFRRLGVKMEGTAVNGTFLVWPHLDDSVQVSTL